MRRVAAVAHGRSRWWDLYSTAFVAVVVIALVAVAAGAVGAVGEQRAAAHDHGDHVPGAPAGLTVDDDAAPHAVEGPPQFGWRVIDADRNEVQTAYELIVATAPVTKPHDRRVVWASGRVASSQQSYVVAPTLRLVSDRTYYWTVRTWDRAGQVGTFAAPARFDTGLTDTDWHADWVRRRGIAPSAVEDFTLMRKEIRLAVNPVVRARAYVSAGQQYDLRVNGVRVAHGPSFSYPDEQYYEATDITTLLRAGATNAIGVVTHWETPGQGRPASVPGLIARISIEHANGQREIVTTDGTWRTHGGPWVQGRLRNDEGDHVEHIDGRADPVGWDTAGFDDRGWTPALLLGPHPVTPFLHLFAARSHIVEHTVAPRTLIRLADGSTVADFGQVIAATPVVRFRRGVAGRSVKVVGGFLLDPNGHVSTTKGVQQTDMHWDYDERGGAQEFRPFGYLGYRYLEVDGANETLGTHDLLAVARHASMPDEHAATFETSNSAIDAVWNLARHSALYATQEQVLDTPTREKGAFLDGFVSPATMDAFGERAVTYQALRDVARSQRRYWPDGRVNVVYPNGDGARDIPDSTEYYVEWVWRVYMTTGDRDQLASLYPVVKNISDYVARAIDANTGLVTNLPGGGGDYLGGIVDWPPNMRYGYDMATAARTTENILAVDVFHRVAQIADELRRPHVEASTERDRATRLTEAIHRKLTGPDGVFIDGLEPNGTPSPHASQQANAYALAYGLVPGAQVDAVADYVVRLGNAMGVSTFANLVYGLHAAGRDRALVEALTDPRRPGYAQILAEGATFTWEAWDARQTGDSESHGFGSLVLAVLQDDVLGVTVAAPGAARVDVRTPALAAMRASGIVSTQRGPIPISWSRGSDGRFSLDLTIPANVVATVHIPTAHPDDIRDDTRALGGDPGIIATRVGRGEVVLTIGSGHYTFRVDG
jgi:alpha-L-rhamnosidase